MQVIRVFVPDESASLRALMALLKTVSHSGDERCEVTALLGEKRPTREGGK